MVRIGDILLGRCPACRKGKVTRGVFGIYRRCEVCGHDFHPEPGYYLGAMVVAYLVTAMLTIPPMIALKIADVDLPILLGFPFAEYAILCPVVIRYSRVAWLHVEYALTHGLDRRQ